ncbi:rhotekin-2 [Thalassophryne amazonica]|uniref:rhotekin-2 n=1 Tax=Thalassophryne amazonica TaxID=390379 RepID=UPI0014712D47|nr:rhotekin-2 [Thalassophryne amazonica]
MADQRDVQTGGSRRKEISSCSATAMEIKRKKIRQSSLFLQTEDADVQEKLDFEVRMREGAYKLLLACTKREPILNASKNLQTCNTRIKAYLTQLQAKREERGVTGASRSFTDAMSDDCVPCKGTVAISGLRIPLMWRDSDHFNNRGSSRRVAAFCLMQIDSEVFDTQMMVVDRSVTDICFEGITIFKDAVPQFELKVELWSCALEEELTSVNTPKKLAKKIRSSLGKTSGMKLRPLLDSPDSDSFLQQNPVPSGAKFSLLASTTLHLPQAEGSFQSHSFTVLQGPEWSSWLPLYGNLCCRLVAQPACMTQCMMTGYLSHKQNVDGLFHCYRLYCVLSAGVLSCYFTPEEIDAKVQPTINIPINEDTRICVLEKEAAGQKSRSLSIIYPSSDGSRTIVFSTDAGDEMDEWADAFHQHLYDQSQWLHCCDQLMKIEIASPRKPSLFLAKQADCVYNDLSINSPGKFESIIDIIHNKIEETDGRFLVGQEDERDTPNWSSLFDGSHSVMVQKSLLSHSDSSTPCSSPTHSTSSMPTGNKKRRAPPPPPGREPYAPPTRPARPPLPALVRPPTLTCQEKENSDSGASRLPMRSKTGRPSLDAKFSAIIQQLQRNNARGAAALSRKNAPLGVLDVLPQHPEHQDNSASIPDAVAGPGPGLLPTQRTKLGKSFREQINLKPV